MSTAGACSLEPPLTFEVLIFCICVGQIPDHVRKEENVMICAHVEGSWPNLSVDVILDKNNLAFSYNDPCHERGQTWGPSF